MRTALTARVGDLHRVIEEHHHAVAGKALERALMLEDQRAHDAMIIGEYRHDLLGLRMVGEGREPAHVEERHHYFAPVSPEQVLAAAVKY